MNAESTTTTIAAIDVGGANLKVAHGDGTTRCRAFAVWREPHRLADAIESILSAGPAFDRLAVTMTAELCDCFATKREGVTRVLDAVDRASARISPAIDLLLWRNDGCLVRLPEAREDPLALAAANWRALATHAGSLVADAGPALVADMGSTTVDLVAIENGIPVPRALDDTGRLLCGELVYTGLRRTPVSALVDRLPLRGRFCPVIPELFATAQDAYVLLGVIGEDPADHDTADGRPLTRQGARDRLARMVGADRETFTLEDARQAAAAITAAQSDRIVAGLRRIFAIPGSPSTVVVAGEGENVLRDIIARLWPRSSIRALSEDLDAEASRAACAHGLVWLLRTGIHDSL